MRVAVIAAGLFFGGMLIVTSELRLRVWQLFNAIFIGILAGIRMIDFQKLMPGQPGAAAALYANSVRGAGL